MILVTWIAVPDTWMILLHCFAQEYCPQRGGWEVVSRIVSDWQGVPKAGT